MNDFIEIHNAIKNSVVELFKLNEVKDHLVIEPTKKDFIGDITLITFPILRYSKKPPQDTAELIGAFLTEKLNYFESYNVVKGFLNLVIKQSYWLSQFKKWVNEDDYGFNKHSTGQLYMVEYSSPNTNKPLHLGHLRNIFLGDTVSNLFNAVGHDVIRTQIINDRGIHICKSMLAWKNYGKGQTPTSSGVKGDHFVGKYYVLFDQVYKQQVKDLVKQGVEESEAKKKASILLAAQDMLVKWENKDEDIRSLWKEMNEWVYDGFNKTYDSLNVSFDHLYYESNTYEKGKEVVVEGVSNGCFYSKKDRSVWCDLSKKKLDDKLLLRSDGTSVYMTQDIGTAVERFMDYPKLSGIIYTVGNEQNHHFKVLFEILSKLKYDWSRNCHHLSYGMVELPEGKMKSREGTVVDADDLLNTVIKEAKLLTAERGHLEGMQTEEIDELCQKIGVAGLKYFLLKVDPKKKMSFDPKESIDLNGNTGPFVQYGYARIKSLLQKVDIDKDFKLNHFQLSDKELGLIKVLSNFPNTIRSSSQEMSPAILSNYLFNLVKSYNSFYQDSPIIKEANVNLRIFRIQLSHLTAEVIKKGMGLMGIEVPERM